MYRLINEEATYNRLINQGLYAEKNGQSLIVILDILKRMSYNIVE